MILHGEVLVVEMRRRAQRLADGSDFTFIEDTTVALAMAYLQGARDALAVEIQRNKETPEGMAQ